MTRNRLCHFSIMRASVLVALIRNLCHIINVLRICEICASGSVTMEVKEKEGKVVLCTQATVAATTITSLSCDPITLGKGEVVISRVSDPDPLPIHLADDDLESQPNNNHCLIGCRPPTDSVAVAVQTSGSATGCPPKLSKLCTCRLTSATGQVGPT